MVHVSIVVAKDELPNLLKYAGSKQLFHLTEVEDDHLPDGAARYKAIELAAKSSTVKNRLASLTTALQIGDVKPGSLEAPVDNLGKLAVFLEDETLKLEHEVRQIDDEQGKLQTEKEQAAELSRFLSGLENVGVSLDSLAGAGFLSSLAGESSADSIGALQRELDQITYGNLIFAITNTSAKTQTFLAIFPNAFQEDAKQAVTALGAKLGPPWTDLPANPKEAKETIDLKLSELENGSKKLAEAKNNLAKNHGPEIKSLTVLSDIFDARTKALAGSSETESTVLLQAWTPERKIKEVAEELPRACNGLATMYVEEKADEHHAVEPESSEEADPDPPSLITAPGWTNPLQSVINNFGVPDYRETNPLLFMIFTFPIMYGMMFGDFGEGPLLLLLGVALLRIKKRGGSLGDFLQPFVNGAELIVMLGIGTTIFGLIFGDFFGFESGKLFGFGPLFSPLEGQVTVGSVSVPTYMVVTLAFGVFHLLFGMALGAFNKIRNGEFREAFFGPICQAWFYAAGVFIIAQIAVSGFKFSIALQNPLYLPLVLAPLALSAWKEGGMHAMELFIQSISNTFSYLRIWALNLADFYVKFAIFLALGGALTAGVYTITPLSLVGAALGNILVMILEGLIVFVQDLRLHWVEWFGKFYEGTGFPFSPYHEPTSWRAPIK
jgi:V/A-type H+/Na+-transporting ATPase subunit I